MGTPQGDSPWIFPMVTPQENPTWFHTRESPRKLRMWMSRFYHTMAVVGSLKLGNDNHFDLQLTNGISKLSSLTVNKCMSHTVS